jgi:biotin synthase
MINPIIEKAYAILEGKQFDENFFIGLSKLTGEDILDLVSLANKVKNKFVNQISICTIMNAKSGVCNEDCKFCAQSSHNKTEADIYPLESTENIIQKAAECFESGVENFGIVTSGTGYKTLSSEFNKITTAVDEIHQKFPKKNVCVSIGNMTEDTVKELAKHDIHHFNINIQTNPKRYKDLISTTHSINEKIDTIHLLKKHGIKVCCGGIIGLGETMQDHVEMAFALKELDVDVIPINVLIPIKGTPLENQKPLSVSEIVKTFAIFRLINPTKIIKFAAGRETKMKDFQGLIMLAGANGFITGGYLTTRGREIKEDMQFQKELNIFKSK